jgi:molecular chaperone GrpE
VNIIYNKFIKYLESNGVKEMKTTGETFDADIHEAVTTFPTPSEDLKGKIIDTVQKGYSINDKVLRHAKVVVGQ